MFVSSGTGKFGALLDLWRSNNISSATQSGWTLLAEGPEVPLSAVGPMKPHAASVLISPWGVLSVGGMVQGKGVGVVPDVWAIDPVSQLWRDVPIEDGVTSPPTGRWAARAWYGRDHIILLLREMTLLPCHAQDV